MAAISDSPPLRDAAPAVAITVAAAAVAVTIALIRIFRRRSADPPADDGPDLPPYAPVSAREAMAALFGPDGAHFLLRHARFLGRVYRLRPILGERTVVLSDAEAARRILDDPRSSKPFWVYGFADHAAGGSTFFSAEGERWRHVRRSAAPAFGPANLNRTREVCSSILDEWIKETLEPRVEARKPFDVLYEMQRLSIRVVVRDGFGYRISDEEVDMVISSFDAIYDAQKKFVNPLRYLLGRALADNRRAARATESLLGLGRRALEERRRARGSADDAADGGGSIAALLDADPAYASDDERARDLMVFLQAGYDSTAATMAWTLLELARHPEEQALLGKELRAGGGGGPEHAARPRLRRVLRESMRLNPVAAMAPIRSVPEDVRVGKYIVPKGSEIYMPLLCIHRDAGVFEDPDSFRPDRWIDPSEGMVRSIMPFAVGRRNCVGQAMANVEMEVMLGRLCAEYEFGVLDEGGHDHFVILKPMGVLLSAKRICDGPSPS